MDSKLNIGITICLQSEDESVFINGIKQNAIFFAKLLMNSSKNYNVYIVNTSNIKITKKLGWDINKYKTVQYNDVKDKLDIIFPLGGSLSSETTEYLRKRGCKVVPYKCGNEYVISMENVIFERNNAPVDYPLVDQVWNIPQMENTNSHYFRVLHRAESITIPFIWDSMFLDLNIKEIQKTGKNPFYQPSNKPKKLSIFEPNINVYKYAMYPILIAEEVFRTHPELIDTMKVTNTQKIRFNKEFISVMNHLDIVKKGKATFENRFPMPWFLSEHTDVVISHQWENALNYAYLDAIYMGYPIVHNAHLCADCGYYYDGFNVSEGANQLLFALTQHDNNIEEYNENSKKVLERYSTTNKNSIDTYDMLIDNLIEKKISPEDRFTKVYINNAWGNETKSGHGSTIKITENIRKELPKLFKKYNIKKVIDAPCGDFNWMKEIVDNLTVYRGVDIVKDLVDDNNKKYSNDKIKFEHGNILENFNFNGKSYDMIICRDCLVHLDFKSVQTALDNFKASGIKYLLMTHYSEYPNNIDFKKNLENVNVGAWHPINFTKEPFNLLEPIAIIKEDDEYTVPEIKYTNNDKTLSLWKIN